MITLITSAMPGAGVVGLFAILGQTGGSDVVAPPWTLVGIIGALVTALIFVSRLALQNSQETAAQERARGDRLETLVVQFLPALTEANTAGKANTEALATASVVMKDVLTMVQNTNRGN